MIQSPAANVAQENPIRVGPDEHLVLKSWLSDIPGQDPNQFTLGVNDLQVVSGHSE
jgi:hypothetical protein